MRSDQEQLKIRIASNSNHSKKQETMTNYGDKCKQRNRIENRDKPNASESNRYTDQTLHDNGILGA